MRFSLFTFLLVAIVFSSCREARIKDHPDWKKYYEQYGIKNACMIIRDNNHESIHYYNKERTMQRLTPASTFKIFNSLVALETAVASDDQLVIKWDGVPRKPEWDKDMNMREAFKVSCVPYYQEIARRIGPVRMQHFVDTAHYGNATLSGHIDSFWLNNSLQISADEQVGMLKRLYFFELPFSERSQRIVKTLMLQEQTDKYNLYYKTGTGTVGDKNIYWVVGFVERIEHVKEQEGSMNKSSIRNYPFFFAQNFEIPANDTSHDWYKTRIDILHQVLKDYGAMGNESK